MEDKKKTESIVSSIIGEGAKFSGEFEVNGVLRIDGFFSGTIKSAKKVIIGKTGKAKTDIIADEIVIGGKLEGNIYGGKYVELLSTSQVKGDIYTPRLNMDTGVIFEGNCVVNKDALPKNTK
jgi:cytoskeletal protein CcmA (bactofilin family)